MWDREIPGSTYDNLTFYYHGELYEQLNNRMLAGDYYNHFLEDVDAYAPVVRKEDFDYLLSLRNQVVTIDGRYYRVQMTPKSQLTNSYYNINSGTLYNKMIDWIKRPDIGYWLHYEPGPNTFYVWLETQDYTVQLTELTSYAVNYDLTNQNRLLTNDAAYNIFAIPYGSIKVKNFETTILESTIAELGLNTIMAIKSNHGSNIYDIQLLPYCPVPELIDDEGNFIVTSQS